jgi:hypothetical protein
VTAEASKAKVFWIKKGIVRFGRGSKEYFIYYCEDKTLNCKYESMRRTHKIIVLYFFKDKITHFKIKINLFFMLFYGFVTFDLINQAFFLFQ